MPRCAADQTLCLLNLKRLPALGSEQKCVEAKEKRQVFFFCAIHSIFFCRSLRWQCLGFWGSWELWLPALPGLPWQPVCSLLIQDNKCLSLGFRQLFTLSWRLRRGPGTLWRFVIFENVSICPGYPLYSLYPPVSSSLALLQVPATFCIISALGFKVSAVALALICHLEVIFIYSRAKSSGNFMMTFRFQGFSQPFAI